MGRVECLSAHDNSLTRWYAAKPALQCSYEHGIPTLRKVAARAFRNFVRAKAVSTEEKITYEDRALADLVDCLSEQATPEVQDYAASARWHFVTTEDSSLKERIRSEEGLLTGLVSVSKQDNPSLQKRSKKELWGHWRDLFERRESCG